VFKKFKPINDFILVEILEKKDKTESGIFIPTEAQEKNQIAIVIHAGKSTQLHVGEQVFYKKYMGTALDDKYLVLKEEEILGVL
jgi:chaperonin GroES